MEVEFEESPGSGLVTVDDAPYLNPAIVNVDYFDADACVSARGLFESLFAQGDVDDLHGLVQEVLDVLGLAHVAASPGRGPSLKVGANDVSSVVIAERSLMTKGLLEELEELESRQDWQQTAAGLLLGLCPDSVATIPGPLAVPLPLNDSQEQAVEATRRQPLTVVTGPPGTGKSQFVVAAVANAWLDGNTVLVTSTNNAAVDVAVERLAELHQALLIRTGNRAYRDKLPEVLGSAIEAFAIDGPREAEARGAQARAASERGRLLSLLELRSGTEIELGELVLGVERAREMIWPTGIPVDVEANDVADRARRLMGARMFRTWRTRRLLNKLKASNRTRLTELVVWADQEIHRVVVHADLSNVASQLGDIPATLAETEQTLIDTSREAVIAAAAARLEANKSAVSLVPTTRRGGPGLPRAISQAKQAMLGWATTSLSAKQNFELTAGLFDLAVVDEAGQCTLAALLPIAYRAKRIVIVGDPNQLNPIVRLEDRQLARIAGEVGFTQSELQASRMDYRHGSAYLAYEQIAGTDGVRLLDEHYRCHPAIARWFNTAFYGDRLHVLTQLDPHRKGQRGLTWIDIDGVTEHGASGGLRNQAEAELVLSIVEQELSTASDIGVVTPFTAQAALIERLAEQRFGSEALATVDFAIGTAHRFQGQEREIVVFSTVIALNTSRATARWVEQQRNLINVAASRARHGLIVVGHPTAAIDLDVPTLASLRKAAIEGVPYVTADWMVHSEAERRLRDALWQAGLSPLVKPVVDGFELDFGFDGPGIRRTNVEVDGSQHLDVRGKQRRRDVARDSILRNAGWQVLRIPAWRCLSEPQAAALEVAAALSLRLTAAEDAEFTHLARLVDSNAPMNESQLYRLHELAHQHKAANPLDQRAQVWASAADVLLAERGLAKYG